ncbi:MAG: hypothetical protein AAF716_11330 [Cyanobacteria bacterium P01_D01_bin.1]
MTHTPSYLIKASLAALFRATAVVAIAFAVVFTGFAGNAMAYNIDYGMDQARGAKTIEYYGESYGEPLREIVEQAMKNNVNHPEPKPTSQNSYQRKSKLNNLLPERRGEAFSLERFLSMRATSNPNK